MENLENFEDLDKVSDLIREAKPLYRERKQKRVQTNVILGLFLFVLPVIPINNYIQTENILSEESIIEYQGLPTDDYGLLKVY
ncbi:hypothetical protein IJ818_03880 [bacterium]|nr:hypothetical protein [bacterium]